VILRDQNAKQRAVTLFRRLIDEFPQSDLARDATAAATELYTEVGDHKSASLLLERLASSRGASPERADLLYEAATRAKEGNAPDRAVELYEQFLKVTAANDLRTSVARLAVAKAKLAAGKEPEAERAAQETISRAPYGEGEIGQRLQGILAEARLVLGEIALRRYERVRLTEPLDRSIPAKQKSLDEAVRHLTTAASYGFADVSLASTYKIGYLQLAFADALADAPRPRNLRPEEMKRYEELLSEQTRPYREAAEKAFRLTLEQATQAGIENEWTARARSALGRFGGAASASLMR
jgi:cellulose synthase operon protein C